MPERCADCARPMRPARDTGQDGLPRHDARGLCHRCYLRHHRRGDLDRFPPVVERISRAAVLELAAAGHSRAVIAHRLGVTLNAVNLATSRAGMRAHQRPAPPPPGWQDRAACAEVDDPELFYPDGHGNIGTRRIADAKAVCHDCPVRSQCLDFAMATEGTERALRFGIWGGLDERERAALYRMRLSA